MTDEPIVVGSVSDIWSRLLNPKMDGMRFKVEDVVYILHMCNDIGLPQPEWFITEELKS